MNSDVRNKLENSLIKILDEFDRVCKKNNLKYWLVGGTLLGSVRHKGFIPWDDDIDVGMPRDDYEKFIKIYYKELKDDFFLDCSKYNANYWLPFAKIKLKNTVYMESSIKKDFDNLCMWVDIFPIDSTQNNKMSFLEFRKRIIKNIYSILYNKNAKSISDFDSFLKKMLYIILFVIPNKFLYLFRDFIMKLENNKKCKYYINFGSQYSVVKQLHLKEKYFPLCDTLFNEKCYNAPADTNYVLKKIYGDNYMKLPPKEKRITHNPLKIVFEDGEEVLFDEEI